MKTQRNPNLPYYYTPKITSADRKYVSEHKFRRETRSIKYARGTVISTYTFTYIKKGKEIESEQVDGQSTTSQGQTVATEYRGLIRNAYLDALIRFKESRGLSYDAKITKIKHIKTIVQYYGEGKATGKRYDDKTIYQNITDNIEYKKVEFNENQKENLIKHYEKQSRAYQEKGQTPISHKPTKRKQYINPYQTRSTYVKHEE